MKTRIFLAILAILALALAGCSIPSSPAVTAHAQNTANMRMSGVQAQQQNAFWK